MTLSKGFTIGVFAIFAGCASAPAPTERMESTAAAIRAAQEVGAARVPRANLHLQLALEESEHARLRLAKDERAEAASLLMRAQADAELAVAEARESEDRSEAQQAADKTTTLQNDNQ